MKARPTSVSKRLTYTWLLKLLSFRGARGAPLFSTANRYAIDDGLDVLYLTCNISHLFCTSKYHTEVYT